MGKSLGTIVISGINFFEGGPLKIFKECLGELSSEKYKQYSIIALTHKNELFGGNYPDNFSFIEFPLSRKSYLIRLFYEYLYFYFFSRKRNISLWVSLHDTSPIVKAKRQVVYCHNPSVFRPSNFSDLLLQPRLFFQTLLYNWVYKFNVRANSFIIVQQSWIREAFMSFFKLAPENIIVAKPSLRKPFSFQIREAVRKDDVVSFFFPAYPRPFKNFEIICQASEILSSNDVSNFNVYLTIDGTENKYSEKIFNAYSNIKNINFVGILNDEEMDYYYRLADCLIFPSSLETWGLPISEAKQFDLPIILIDLPYAHETLGDYKKAVFFEEKNVERLSELMKDFINRELVFKEHSQVEVDSPKAENWEELFKIILN